MWSRNFPKVEDPLPLNWEKGMNQLIGTEARELKRYCSAIAGTRDGADGFRLYKRAKAIYDKLTSLVASFGAAPFAYSPREERLLAKFEAALPQDDTRKSYQGRFKAEIHLALFYVIEAYKKLPDFFPIKCLYPHCFHLRYSTSEYGRRVIEQYERFLLDVLSVRAGDEAHKQLRLDIFSGDKPDKIHSDLMTTEHEADTLRTYVTALIGKYSSEYEMARIGPLLEALLERDCIGFLDKKQTIDFFIKSRQFYEGEKFFSHAKEKHRHDKAIGEICDVQIAMLQGAAQEPRHHRPNPYPKEPIRESILSIGPE